MKIIIEQILYRYDKTKYQNITEKSFDYTRKDFSDLLGEFTEKVNSNRYLCNSNSLCIYGYIAYLTCSFKKNNKESPETGEYWDFVNNSNSQYAILLNARMNFVYYEQTKDIKYFTKSLNFMKSINNLLMAKEYILAKYPSESPFAKNLETKDYLIFMSSNDNIDCQIQLSKMYIEDKQFDKAINILENKPLDNSEKLYILAQLFLNVSYQYANYDKAILLHKQSGLKKELLTSKIIDDNKKFIEEQAKLQNEKMKIVEMCSEK